ncbi:MAG: SGNH/GDSL hydrolase family protein [Aureliella sp.]
MSRARRRQIILVGLVILILAGTLFHTKYYLSRPIGSGPAGPAVDSESFASPWTDRKVHIVAFGDSITAGLGANSPAHSYVNRLIANPPDEYADMQGKCLSAVLPNLTHANHAVSGTTSLHHIDAIAERLAPHSEETFGIVLLTTGGNDLIHNYGRTAPHEGAMFGATAAEAEPWIENFETRLEEMLALFASAFPGGHEVYLANIYDPTDGVGDGASIFLPPWDDGLEIHAQYNAIIAKAADRHDDVHLVDLHKHFLGHGSHSQQFWREHYDNADPHYWYYNNIEDPNDRGYDAIRRIFLNTITSNTTLIAR